MKLLTKLLVTGSLALAGGLGISNQAQAIGPVDLNLYLGVGGSYAPNDDDSSTTSLNVFSSVGGKIIYNFVDNSIFSIGAGGLIGYAGYAYGQTTDTSSLDSAIGYLAVGSGPVYGGVAQVKFGLPLGLLKGVVQVYGGYQSISGTVTYKVAAKEKADDAVTKAVADKVSADKGKTAGSKEAAKTGLINHYKSLIGEHNTAGDGNFFGIYGGVRFFGSLELGVAYQYNSFSNKIDDSDAVLGGTQLDSDSNAYFGFISINF